MKREVVLWIALFLLVLPFLRFFQSSFTGASSFASGTISLTLVTTNATQNATSGNAAGKNGVIGVKGLNLVDQGVAFSSGTISFLDSPLFSVTLLEGETVSRQIILKNTGELTQTFHLSSTLPFIKVPKESITLRPSQEIVPILTIYGKELGVHTGKIILTGDLFEKQIPAFVTVNSPYASYLVSLALSSVSIVAGEHLLAQLSVRDLEGESASIDYFIKDANNKNIIKINEIRSVTTSFKISKDIKTPSYLKAGSYVLAVSVHYKGKTVSSSAPFTVYKKTTPSIESPTLVTTDRLSLVVLFVIFFVLSHLWIRKKNLHT